MKRVKSKLVRNKIPALARASDSTVQTYLASGANRLALLREKLLEEASEASEAMRTEGRSRVIEELADVLEVLYQISEDLDIKFQDIQFARNEKSKAKGSFSDGAILEWIEET